MRMLAASVCTSLTITFGLISIASAGEPFFDDFEDGDYMDDSPVTWSRYPAPYDLGTVEVTEGNLVLNQAKAEAKKRRLDADIFRSDWRGQGICFGLCLVA